MGRKGIGKLAPFGICKKIEILSAGGDETPNGYLVSHFIMDFDRIVSDDVDAPVPMDPGEFDQTFRPTTGTTVTLRAFLNKRVPDAETFYRQLATRFTFADPDFQVVVANVRMPGSEPYVLRHLDIAVMPETKIDLADRAVELEDGTSLPVSGWLAFAREAYKTEELAGVRIYARNKIVATTRDFEQPAGFTGEFTTRSYLVGEVHAEWLDLDEGEDLVRTDRQGIIWDSEYGQALRRWGAKLIREIASKSAKPRRERKGQRFLRLSSIEERAAELYADSDVAKVAVELAEQIGGFAAEDELQDPAYVEDLTGVILSVAPHKALIQAFQEFNKAATGGEVTVEQLLGLFDKTRIAELASYSQVATERVRIIRRLDEVIQAQSEERVLQELVEDAPWLIEPTWSVLTKNQNLNRFAVEFERFWRERTGETIRVGIGNGRKRPDFTAVAIGQMLHIIEIKACRHTFDDTDFDRLVNYVQAFEEFFEANKHIREELPKQWRIDLVADSVTLRDLSKRYAFEAFERDGRVVRMSWIDFLGRAERAHELFLNIEREARERLAAEERVAPVSFDA